MFLIKVVERPIMSGVFLGASFDKAVLISVMVTTGAFNEKVELWIGIFCSGARCDGLIFLTVSDAILEKKLLNVSATAPDSIILLSQSNVICPFLDFLHLPVALFRIVQVFLTSF
jgi:hypothetical protein